MKPRILLLLLLFLMLTGCGSQADYLSIRPHVEQPTATPPPTESDPIPIVTNRLELRGAILSLIDNWKEQGTVLIQDYEGDVERNLSEVMEYATAQHPTGAYAIDYADAEILERDGQQLVQVSFVFRRSISEINSIVLVDNSDAAYDKITEALANYTTALTLRIRRYSARDFSDAIVSYCMENPRIVPTIPEFSLKLYPEEGDHRIMELHFTYPESKDVMREKLSETETTFQSALSYGKTGKTPMDQAQRLCHYLIRRRNQTLVATAPTFPVYSLLSENKGHDLSYAICYQDLCSSLGISSRIVKGTKNGETYYWNLLVFGDETFHVDLRRYVEEGTRTMIPLYDETLLAEGYSWDQHAYPAAPLPVEPDETTPLPTDPSASPSTAPTESEGDDQWTAPTEVEETVTDPSEAAESPTETEPASTEKEST